MNFIQSTISLFAASDGKINVNNSQFDLSIPRVQANSSTLSGILNDVYFWAGIVAVLVIIIAGIFYATSNGNANQVTRAKNAIIAALVGLVIILSAYVITGFVLRVG